MEGLKKGILVKNNVAVGAIGDKYFSTSPIGVIQAFSGNTAPNGYLICNGASYKVADYPDLYAVIGNTYGGDTENFNVPDYRETVLVGVGENTTDTIATHDVYGLGEFKDDQLQGHNHTNTSIDYKTNSAEVANYAYAWKDNRAPQTEGLDRMVDSGFGTPRVGTTTHGKQKGVTYIIKAFHTNEGVDSGVSDDVINYINNSTKVDVVLYDEFDTKVDNIQNSLCLLGNILFGSLYFRFNEEHNPFAQGFDWVAIADVPQITSTRSFYNCISYAEILDDNDYAQGDVRIWDGKLQIRIRKQPTVSRENWYIFCNSICEKVILAE